MKLQKVRPETTERRKAALARCYMRKGANGAQKASGVSVGREVGVGVGGGGKGIVVMMYPMAMLITTKMLRTKKMI